MAGGGARRANGPRGLWWLHPRFAVLYLGIPLLILSFLIPESAYLLLYGSKKHVDFDFLLVGLLVYTAFVVGTFVFVRTGGRSQEGETIAYCRWIVWPLFLMTLFGYLAWYTSAALNAGGPGALLGAFVNRILHPEIGSSYQMKHDLFQTIAGVTTFTQFGILYATVEALLWVYGAAPRNRALLRFLPLLAFSLVRAVLISERLALVEFGVPIAVVLLSRARWTQVGRPLVRLAPLIAALAVFCLFALGEYFRSWNYYQTIYSGPYIRFAAERFMGYYATAVNNAAVYHYYGDQAGPLLNTFRSLFEFPGLGNAAYALYNLFFEYRGVDQATLLSTYANPEFNNVALIGNLLGDFSVFFSPFAAFLLGATSFSLYKSFTGGRSIGLLLYPSWFIGLLEISRIYYWPGGRYIPVLAFLFVSLLLFKLLKTRVSGQLPERVLNPQTGELQRRAGGDSSKEIVQPRRSL